MTKHYRVTTMFFPDNNILVFMSDTTSSQPSKAQALRSCVVRCGKCNWEEAYFEVTRLLIEPWSMYVPEYREKIAKGYASIVRKGEGEKFGEQLLQAHDCAEHNPPG
jgi:hypothetical protein